MIHLELISKLEVVDPVRSFAEGDFAPIVNQPLSEDEIRKGWVTEDPVVSVVIPTFNQSEFIRDAIWGVLSQITKFPFEILIRDDGSHDGTQAIIFEVADSYPNMVRTIFEESNTWVVTKPLAVLERLARGKFIAICEGDDYWIDPYRLQRHIELLEAAPNASFVFGDAISIRDGLVVRSSKLAEGTMSIIPKKDLLRGFMAPFPATTYRNMSVADPNFESRMLSYDLFLYVRLGLAGYGLSDGGHICAVHRLREGSAYFGISSFHRRRESRKSFIAIADWLESKGEHSAAKIFLARSLRRKLLYLDFKRLLYKRISH